MKGLKHFAHQEESKSAKKRFTPAKWGVLAFAAFCLALWGLGQPEQNDGSFLAENLLADDKETVSGIPVPPETDETIAGLENSLILKNSEENKSDAVPADGQDETAEADAAASTGETVSGSSFYAAYRLDRDESRAEELAVLAEIIADTNSTEENREAAETRRLAVAKEMDQEALAENILAAKGYGETVVLMGEEQATVVCGVKMDAVTASSIAQVVSESCQIGYESVVIINR